MAFQGYNFLDKLLNPAVDARLGTGADTAGQKKFIAQAFQPPVSPRSTIVLFDVDDLLPVTPVSDRYRSPDEPPAFEISFVFPTTDLAPIIREFFPGGQLSEVNAAEARAEIEARDPSFSLESAFDILVGNLEDLEFKRKKLKRGKDRALVDKVIATEVDNFIKNANNDSRVVALDLRNRPGLLQRWVKLSKDTLRGLQIGGNFRNDRQIDAPGIGVKENFEQQSRLRREILEQIQRLESIPALAFTVPPKEISLKMSKILFDGNLTQGGFQIEHWGEALDVLSVSGSTGGFYSVVRQTGCGGLNHQLRRGSRAFQEFMALVTAFKNNGYVYHTLSGNGGQVNLPAALIQIQMGVHTFIGRFDEFSFTETEDKPFSLDYSFTFTSFATFMYGTDSGASQVRFDRRTTTAPQDSAVETPPNEPRRPLGTTP